LFFLLILSGIMMTNVINQPQQVTKTITEQITINPDQPTIANFDMKNVLITFSNNHFSSLKDSTLGKQAIEKVKTLSNLIINQEFSFNPILSVSVPSFLIPVIEKIPGVVSVDEDDVLKADLIPNDPSYSQLWGMNKIQAPQAWDTVTGSSQVVVAVIDEGIQINHPDLQGNIWVNPGEIAGNGIDDDNNGYIDDVNGWDFANNDKTVYDGGSTGSSDTHGSHVAGTIGAVGNNGVGIAGVNWNVKLMSLKFLGATGGSTTDAIKAVEYATAKGAKIISASWGGGGYNAALETAISNFPGLFVAAAGNDGLNNDASPHYPSSYSPANILSVASSTETDGMSSFSNYGATSVDIAAPGSNIYSTLPYNTYGSYSGTSMATPHVSGAAALLLANDPTLTTAQLKAKLMDTIDPLPAFTGKVVSGGRLNVFKALTGSVTPPPSTVTDTFSGTVSSTTPNVVHTFSVPSTGTISATLSWGTTADLDMYLYPPGVATSGTGYVVRAYTTANPESLSYSATQTGTWAMRVNLYSGATSTYSLSVTHPGSASTDTTAPVVTISSPTNGATVSGTVSISASATDNSGTISSYAIKIDGTSVATTNSYSWDTTTATNGAHTIVVEAKDPSNNVGSATVSVTVSNTASNVLTSGVPASGTLGGSVLNVGYTISVASGASSMHIVLDPQTASYDFDVYQRFNTAVSGCGTTSCTGYDNRGYTSGGEDITVSNPSAGTHYIAVQVYSGSGAYTLTVTLTYTTTQTFNFSGSLSGAGNTQAFNVNVNSGAKSIRVILTGPTGADFDVYGKLGSTPTTSVYDLRGYTTGNEDVTSTNPGAGTWYIMARSYSGSGAFSLQVIVTY
jgi:subtilisin family serine protease